MITRIVFAMAMISPVLALAATDAEICTAMRARWNDQPSMEKLIENFEKEMGPEMFTLLSEKTKGAHLLDASPPKLEKISETSFVLNFGKLQIPIEIKSLATSTIVVNHHELNFKSDGNAHDILKKMQSSLPPGPSAYAAAALYESIVMVSRCVTLKALRTQCLSSQTVVNAHTKLRNDGDKSVTVGDDIVQSRNVIDEIEKDPSLKTAEPALCEGKVKAVQNCVSDFVALAKRNLNSDLHEISRATASESK